MILPKHFGWSRTLFPVAHASDLRYTFRVLRSSAAFSAVTIIVFALGIGASTAIFSVFNAVALRPLRFDHSGSLVRLLESFSPRTASDGAQRLPALQLSEVLAFRERSNSIVDVGVYSSFATSVLSPDGAARLVVTRVSPLLLAAFAPPPEMGRVFETNDEAPNAPKVAVLGYSAWLRHFGASVQVLQRPVRIDGVLHTIVGVMPAGFEFPDAQTGLWVPATLPPIAGSTQRAQVVGRLRDGISRQDASRELSRIVAELRGGSPTGTSQFEVVTLKDELISPVVPMFRLVLIAGAVVLLLTILNVAMLFVARLNSRRQELAVRLALGGTLGRVRGLALSEATVLAVAGGIGGVLVAHGVVQLVKQLGTTLVRRDLGTNLSIPRLDEVAVDNSSLVFTIGISIFAGLASGLIPAMLNIRRDAFVPANAGRQLRSSKHFSLGSLVLAQMTLTLALLTVGGLLIDSFVRLNRVDVGFAPNDLITFRISVPAHRASEQQIAELGYALVAKIESLTGPQSAGFTQMLPMVQSTRVIPVGRSREELQKPTVPALLASQLPPEFPNLRLVSRHLLHVMRVPVIEGRSFSANDSQRELLVNDTLARSGRFDQVVDSQIYAGGWLFRVIGVTGDVPQLSLDRKPHPQVFVPYGQLPGGPGLNMDGAGPYFVVRTALPMLNLLPQVRVWLQELDADATVHDPATMEQIVSNSLARPRLFAVLIGIFAALALGLCAIGIFGLQHYALSNRTREIGIRMAIGAQRAAVVLLITRQLLTLSVIATSVGVVFYAAVTPLLRSMLFGVERADLTTFLVAVAVLLVSGALAAAIPVYRAINVDPVVALRNA